MNTDKYTVGSQLESWNGSTAQSLTFIELLIKLLEQDKYLIE